VEVRLMEKIKMTPAQREAQERAAVAQLAQLETARMNENEPTASEVQEEWFSLRDLGELSANEKAMRDAMCQHGYKPEKIRETIEQRRVSELASVTAEPQGVAGYTTQSGKRFVSEELVTQYQSDIRVLEEGTARMFDELKLLRQHAIALYEVLTTQQFVTTDVTTVDLLQFLTTKGRELLDGARMRTEAATNAEAVKSQEVYQLQKKTDVVIGLLAQALMACTTSSASSQSPAAGPPTSRMPS
jgi:hypothetical protein